MENTFQGGSPGEYSDMESKRLTSYCNTLLWQKETCSTIKAKGTHPDHLISQIVYQHHKLQTLQSRLLRFKALRKADDRVFHFTYGACAGDAVVALRGFFAYAAILSPRYARVNLILP